MHEPRTLAPSFDYAALDPATRELVVRATDETQHLLQHTAESIIAIGERLRLVQEHLPPMSFSAWLRAEFGLSRQTAYNYINVAARFSGRCQTVGHLPAGILYALASSSEEIVGRVEAGELAPTLPAIRAAKAAEKQARAEAAEQQATLEALATQLAAAQQQLADLAASPVEIREVERQVIPPELVNQLEQVQHSAQALAEEREALMHQIAELEAQLQAASSSRLEGEEEQRIHLNWYRITSEFSRSVHTLLSRWPQPIDTQAFSADDWARLSQSKALARRFVEECERLSRTCIIDMVSEPTEVAEPEHFSPQDQERRSP